MALDFQKINELISHNRISEAINLINDTLDSEPQNESAWFWRGKLHWRMGNRRQAINDYTKAVEINPNSPAKRAIELAQDIDNFFNPDVFNP